jgi:hypothetical protein
VLLEIAHWKSIDQILCINLEQAGPNETMRVGQRLLADNSEALGFMKSYSWNPVDGAVRACLTGSVAFGLDSEADEKSEIVAAQLQRAFRDIVIGRLASIKGV